MFGHPKKVLTEFLNIKHCKIIPHYPQVNKMIEKFMKVLSKAIKTSVYENRNRKEDLHDVIIDPTFMQQQVTLKRNFFSINHYMISYQP